MMMLIGLMCIGEYGIVYKAHLIKPMIAPRLSRSSLGDVTPSDSGSKTASRRVSRHSTVFFQNPTQPLTVAVKTLKGIVVLVSTDCFY